MRKNLLFVFLFLSTMFLFPNMNAQFYDGFTGTGNIGGNCIDITCNENGWFTHSGTLAGTIDIINGSLTYDGLQAPTGNKVYIPGSNTTTSRDVNAAITVTGNVAYFSALINVQDNTQLGTVFIVGTSQNSYFLHFGATSGNGPVTVLFGRLGIISVNTGANYRLGISNTSGGTPTYTEFATDLNFGTTYLVVVKYDYSINTASLWINPSSLGGSEPAGQVTNNSGTSAISAFGSVCIRNASATPKAYIDEIRVGTTWAEVTPEASTATVDWCNLQWPASGIIDQGGNYNVYAQAWENGVTNQTGQTPGLECWIGYSTDNTNPNTWTNWVPAVFNNDVGNNDEFVANIGTGLPFGSYFYASRFRYLAGPYTYGGYNAASGGFWDGTTNVSGTLTVNQVLDNNSTVNNSGVTQPVGGNVSSLMDTQGEAFEIFRFKIEDIGGDGLPTKVSEITIKAGINNTADWTTDFNGGYLFKVGTGALTITTSPTVLPGQVTFYIDPAELDVPNGTSQEIILYVWFNQSVTDNAVIECMVDANNHGFLADATGSTFAADFGTDVLGNQFLIDVDATQFTYIAQPTNVYVNQLMNDVIVGMTDANLNVDVDVASTPIQLVFSGTGLILGTNPVSSINGISTFSDLSFNTTQNGVFLTAHDVNGTTTFIDLQSNGFNITEAPTIPNVFFSEYLEGTSNNKALEIYNGTGGDIDLSQFVVKQANNGSGWGNYGVTPDTRLVLPLTGTLAAGAVYVIASSGAGPEILAVADLALTYNGTANGCEGCNVPAFNGDDAIGLFYNGNLIDVIGIPTVDPGTAWDVAGVVGATAEHTLVRKYPDVTIGNTDWSASAGTNVDDSEWIVYAQNDFSYIGWHGDPPVGPQLIITYPINGGTVPSTDIQAAFSILNFTIPTDGYIEYTYDGGTTILNHTSTDPISITGLTDGVTYTLSLELVDPSGNSLIPAVTDAVTFTVAVPVTTDVATIAELRAGNADGTIYRLTGEAVLTFQQAYRGQKWIEDGTGAILVDDNPGMITTVYNQYDGITNITGTLYVYNGLIEFNPILDPGAATSTGNTVTPQIVDVATLLAGVSDYESELVTVLDATFDEADGTLVFATGTNYTLTDASATLNFRTSFYSVDYIGTVIPYNANVTALVGNYNGTAQITSRDLADIDVIINDYTVTFNVDMTDSIGSGYFVEGTDQLWVAGSMNGWTMPGDDALYEMVESATDNIYTVDMILSEGDYVYKYFKIVGGVSSWDNGEWTGDPNRSFTLLGGDLILNDVFGVKPGIGVDDISTNISIYPNPSNGAFNIYTNSKIGLEVIDITGKVMNRTIISGNTTINIEKSGIYFMRFSNEEGSTIRKVIVQ
jgi:hypothetical protein